VKFRARLGQVGVNRSVALPAWVSSALGRAAHLAVRGRVGGIAFADTMLVPGGGGRHRLFVHSRIWRALGVDAGDLVEVEIELDPAPSEAPVPAEIAAALCRDAAARARFEAMSLAGRRRLARWVAEAKSGAVRSRRAALGLERIAAAAHRRPTPSPARDRTR
jgi:hypothetical protein